MVCAFPDSCYLALAKVLSLALFPSLSSLQSFSLPLVSLFFSHLLTSYSLLSPQSLHHYVLLNRDPLYPGRLGPWQQLQ